MRSAVPKRGKKLKKTKERKKKERRDYLPYREVGKWGVTKLGWVGQIYLWQGKLMRSPLMTASFELGNIARARGIWWRVFNG